MWSTLPRVLFAASLVLLGTAARAEPPTKVDRRYVLKSWETDDGLPHNLVNAIVKRSDGYIWIATLAGLARFDGFDFTPVLSPLVQTDKSQSVRSAIEENPDTLLLACDNTGLLRLRAGEVTVHPLTALFPPGQHAVVLFSEEREVFWLAFGDHAVWRCDHGAVEKFPFPPGASFNWPTTFARDRAGRVFVARGIGVEQYRDGALAPVPWIPAEPVTLGSSATGGVWAVTSRRIYRLEGEGAALLADPVPWPAGPPPTALQEARDGSLWVGLMAHGAWHWSRRESYPVETSYPRINDIEEDAEGDVWLATSGGGLDLLRPTLFSVLAPDPNWVAGASASVCEDAAGDLWYANRLGIHRIEGGQEKPRLQPERWPPYGEPICADRSGHVWIAANERLYLARAGSSEPPAELPRTGGGWVRAIFAARDGSVWVGRTSGPIERYRDGRPEFFGRPEGYAGSSFAQAIGEDAAGHIWIGDDDGRLFEWSGGRLRRYGREDGLPGGGIRAIYGDAEGTLWVGTHGAGLVIRREGRFLRVGGAQGLPDEIVSQLLEDDFGSLWFGTSRRLFRAYKQDLLDCALGRKATITPMTYGRSDGLSGFSAIGSYQPTAWKTAAGQLWFATRKGLVTTDPARQQGAQPAPRAYLDRFAVNGRSVRDPRPDLASSERKYEFRFSAPAYSAPQDVRFRYRLEGLEADWSEPTAERVVSYSTLAPGSYRFRVTACNGNLVWNPIEATVAFRVRPVWWETWWARAAALGLVGTGLVFLVRFLSHRRLKARLERLEMKQQLEAERARIARDLHDGLGASLTQVSMMAEEMAEDIDNMADLKSQSARLVDRVRTIARDLEGAVWAASPQHDTLSSLSAYLSQFALEYFRNTSIRCHVDVSHDIPPLPIPPEARHHLFMIAKETMNNALKHSHATRIDLSIRMRGGDFELVLADNGRGFDPRAAAASERSGLRNMHSRAAEVGGGLGLESSARGTSVRVRVPVAAGAAVPRPA